jgi:hypothetical protein
MTTNIIRNSYVWQEQQSLFDVSTEALMDGRIKWGPVPVWAEPSKALHNEHEKGMWRNETYILREGIVPNFKIVLQSLSHIFVI